MKSFFEVKDEKKLRLAEIPTWQKPWFKSHGEYKSLLDSHHKDLEKLQTILYAGQKKSLLIIFQGMDTAGKDGAIKHVMAGVNPQGCHVVSFKTPSETELDHDFLWRVHSALPMRGEIGIFNRSYYEEALITRVHPEILVNEKLPIKRKAFNKSFWEARYQDIVNFEKYLHRQGFEVIKIFIHISKKEQKKRLLARFSDSKKLWKISESDVRERGFWKEYQRAYEECLKHTSTKNSPWYIVSGDDKESARLTISQIVITRLKEMKLEYPHLSHSKKAALYKLQETLLKE